MVINVDRIPVQALVVLHDVAHYFNITNNNAYIIQYK